MATRCPGYHPSHQEGVGEGITLKQQGFYHTSAWRRIRKLALQRDHYLCQACLKENRFTKATEVHHIKPLEDFPEFALELSNLQSLCWDCHEQTKSHGREVVKVPLGVRVIRVANGESEE